MSRRLTFHSLGEFDLDLSATRLPEIPIKASSAANPPIPTSTQFKPPTITEMSIDSTLLGVALIVRSRDGPRFVFHYPPRFNDQKRGRPPYGTELDPTGPEDSDLSAEDDDDVENTNFSLYTSLEGLGLGKKATRHVDLQPPWQGDEVLEGPDGGLIVPWEHLDAFTTADLASILTPARPFHKKCFELTLDPLTFVTYPMHIREDGRWKKKKRDRRSKKKREETEEAVADDENIEKSTTMGAAGTEALKQEDYHTIESPGVEEIHKRIAMPRGQSFHSEDNEGGMTMFNLVFIMNPKKTEAPAKVQDMFEHIAKDINKALRYAQNYSNYVWKESDLILNMKEKAKDNQTPMSTLWDHILLKSSLAKMMKEVFTSISRSNIAVVTLPSDPPVRLSVQIPKPYFTSMLPEFDEPSQPGLWITTANFLGDQEKEFDDETSLLSKHFALLLLDDEEKTVRDIEADGGELAAPLLEYLKIVRPTLSFHQTATQHAISLSDIRILAQHLIYHRRAIAIPPLHPRDTYIVSPQSPNGSLPHFSKLWEQKFPLAPALPTFLAGMSRRPAPYKTYIPSKTHRPVYISMLGWLLRYGWVTQLRTFTWVIAWPEIKYEVEYELEGARLRQAIRDLDQEAVEAAIERAESRAVEKKEMSTHPHSQAALAAKSETASTTSATRSSTEETAERARLQRQREKVIKDLADFEKKPKPEATQHPSLNRTTHLKGMTPSLILDPVRAEHVDSLLLAAISRRLDGPTSSSTATQAQATTSTAANPASGAAATTARTAVTGGSGRLNGEGKEKEEDKKSFLRWAKYFNGRTSMERIALLDGVKRKEVWARIGGWDEFLHVVRTW